ncbi:hypothetical protein [Pandoraea sputorum]|uniref:Lipoprotein n=1 Tax=Pandoraea sputorum TaxID=93222 RepID=A0A5E5BFM5_9BURK|nr:hypothetical protein [Pandoraea sputorum]VVE84961.1 hypothetical protein PSP31121_05015 [Pandoraea sputorum]
MTRPRIIIATLSVLALSACGQSDDVARTPPPASASAGSLPNGSSQPQAASPERPAAKFASAAERSSIEKFTSDVWKLVREQDKAHNTLLATQKQAVSKGDASAFASSLLAYQTSLKGIATRLDNLTMPEVADKDTDKFMNLAIGNARDAIEFEMDKNIAIAEMLSGRRDLPESEIAARNSKVNGTNALAVLYLNRIYWNYGYETDDIDEKSFTLKKSAKPSETTSFTRS